MLTIQINLFVVNTLIYKEYVCTQTHKLLLRMDKYQTTNISCEGGGGQF